MPSRLLLCAAADCPRLGWQTRPLVTDARNTRIVGPGLYNADARCRRRITPLPSRKRRQGPLCGPCEMPTGGTRRGLYLGCSPWLQRHKRNASASRHSGMQDSSDRDVTASCGNLRSFCEKLRSWPGPGTAREPRARSRIGLRPRICTRICRAAAALPCTLSADPRKLRQRPRVSSVDPDREYRPRMTAQGQPVTTSDTAQCRDDNFATCIPRMRTQP